MFKKRLYTTIFFLLTSFVYGIAQTKDLKFEKIDTKDGLSQNNVSTIAQDETGFMWIGTKDGLNKYDGYNFYKYNKDFKSKNSIGSNDIKIISLDKTGLLWVKDVNGSLDILNINKEKFENPYRFTFNNIQCIFHDRANNTWIGTLGDGVYKIDKAQNKIINYKHSAKSNSISSNQVNTIKEDSEGNIWIGTNNAGINVIENKTKRLITYSSNPEKENALPHNVIKFIFEDKKKNIWIGTDKVGLILFRPETKDFLPAITLNSMMGRNHFLSIEEDRNGILWLGTENEGLYLYDPVRNQSFSYQHADKDPSSISSNTISFIKRDRAGNMWLGTSNSGISLVKVNSGRFTHYNNSSQKHSISNNIVNCFFEDSKKNIWIGTDGGGLNKFNEKTGQFTVYKHDPQNSSSISGNYVLCITEDSQGNIWTGTWGQGVSILNKNGKFTHLKNDPTNPLSLSNNFAFSILKDSKDRIWVGTYGGGLNLYDKTGKKIKHYNNDEKDLTSICSNYILALKEDRKGNIWIGTDGRGINLYNEETQQFESQKYRDPKIAISNLRIVSIHEDNLGFLWLATDYGLNKFDPVNNKNTSYFTENGLADNLVTSVISDNKGFIWASTYKGLSRINPKNNFIENFTIEDGLQEDEFKSGKLLSSSGRLYFGGINGFNSFFPDSIKEANDHHKVVFTNFQIFNKNVLVTDENDDSSPLKATISNTKEITIPYYLSVFSFEFATLNYSSKDKNQYAYQLHGFDNTWHELGNKNSVTFTNLDAGTYNLKIKALASNGQWSKNITEIKLIITPPFWKTWWFILLEIILVTAIIITIFYLRLASIKQRNLQLRSLVAARTHELSETNSYLLESNEKIQIQNISLEESNKEINRKTEKILNQQKHIIVQNQELENTVKQLEGSNKTKDKLFSILAHDLKNPVAALSGIIDMLNKKAPDLSKEEIHNYVKNINTSSSSINDLITNLLDWTRTQSESLVYEPAEINLHELIMKNVFLAETQLTNKNISCHVSSDISHYVLADKYMVDTIVRNILSNAIKFTHLNGDITITSENKGDQIAIIFEDTGIGITQEQIDDIQNHQNKSISYGTLGETGTRLGLHLVKEFIDINKGSLEVKSEQNKGSVFIVSLPVAQTPNHSKNIDYEFKTEKVIFNNIETDSLKGKSILIVDDNEELRNFLKLMLSGTLEIFEATNGKEGFKIAKESQPDIIITDMIMPVVNGLQFCHQIKNDSNTSHIPVVLLTSNTDEEGQIAAYEAGADTFLPKPINQKILFRVLLNLIINQENTKNKFAVSENILPEGVSYNKLDEEFLENISNYIEENISDTDLDYKKLCEITTMSRTVLYAKFKTLTGIGVHDFIKNIRLKKALQLFQEGKLNMSQIAYEVGFATPSYFSKSFTKRYNLTPKEYVAKIKEKTKEAKSKKA
jgi:ligand-binding sensor domain-containing protein/signal transduction histidine kinase/CheY-like chemotaxis protein/AraC-like DNA-binding protein